MSTQNALLWATVGGLVLSACGGASTTDKASTDGVAEPARDGGDEDGQDGTADGGEDTAPPEDSGDPPLPGPPTLHIPPTGLTADALGVVFNADWEGSEAIARRYAELRGIPDNRVVGLDLGTAGNLSREDFAIAQATLESSLDDSVQALLLTFTTPYRVDCMGASAAFGLGFDTRWCQPGPPCNPTAEGPLYGVETNAPWTEHHVRPTMMLFHEDADLAEAFIQRGIDGDDSLPGLDHGAKGRLVHTTDAARSVRERNFRAAVADFDSSSGLDLAFVDTTEDGVDNELTVETDLLFYLTGLATLSAIDTNAYLPGALADHLTSYGGVFPTSSQTPATAWLEAGATASYGTAIEPCNYPQKFPRATELLPAYFQGATAVEAYWRAVEWPGEGNWVGEPLSRPFGHRTDWAEGVLTIDTSAVDPTQDWRIEVGDSADGPWEALSTGAGPVDGFGWVHIEQTEVWDRHYRLVIE